MKKLFFNITSASWFKQLSNQKMLKFEVFYMYMTVACFLVGIGIGREVELGVEFQWPFYVLITPFLIGFIMRLASYFYTPSKLIEDQFPFTQLFRFLDIRYMSQKKLYPNWRERLKHVRRLWDEEFSISPEWVMRNPPMLQRLRVLICVGATCIGLILALLIY